MVKFVSEDGRAFTDYRPNYVMNEELKKSKNLKSSSEYNKYIQANAESIIISNRKAVAEKYKTKKGCGCKSKSS